MGIAGAEGALNSPMSYPRFSLAPDDAPATLPQRSCGFCGARAHKNNNLNDDGWVRGGII